MSLRIRPLILVCVGLLMAFSISMSARAQTLLRDAEIEQFLVDYSHPLFVAAGLDPDGVEIYLVGDNTLNAFVTNGLKVFVHTGLITAADTPNQIEGVLAHETGHLAGGHQQRGGDAFAQAQRPAILSLVLGAAIIAAGGPPEAGLALTGLGQTIGIREYLAYNRGQESAADQAAVRYLEDVGSSGAGLVEFFETLSNRQLISSARNIDPYLLTHPLPLRRISILREQVAEQSSYENANSEEEIFRLQMIQAKIKGFINAPQATMRQYPLRDQSPPARYARAVAYYRASQLDNALREINRLIESDPDNPFFAELKGQMLFEHGRVAESIGPHRRSTELAPQYALLQINLARSLIALDRREEMEEAVTVLRSALRIEPNSSFGWSELARAYAAVDRSDLANLAQAQAYFAVGNMGEAYRFASRAQELLEENTPEHLQALDIIRAAEQAARRGNRRR